MPGCLGHLHPLVPSSTSSAWCCVASAPPIWRRLLVRSDSSIADLHATLQLALGWSDDHLHRFVAHGREYGVEPNTAESGNGSPAGGISDPGGGSPG